MIGYLTLLELGEQLEVVSSNVRIPSMECVIRLPIGHIRKLDEDIYIRTHINSDDEDERKSAKDYKSTANEIFLNIGNITIHVIEGNDKVEEEGEL